VSGGLVVTHRRRGSPLHAARAGIGAAWCVALCAVALSFEHPLLLASLVAIALAAGAAARVGREVARAAAWAAPFAVVIAAVNALVVRDGVTVVFRGATVPGLGRLDVTAEAIAFGGVLGLRAVAIFAAAALLAAAIDPDELLRAVRRRSLRAGVTAALATHLIPVLARDARRLADAQRALTGGPPNGASRLGVLRAVTSGALDRATDVAATLEVRGFGVGGRPQRRARPLSRHDLAFAASAIALAALAVVVGLGGWEGFEAYPRTVTPVDARLLVLVAALAGCALLPFADRRAIEPAG
jgi:energy-coupling factor transport system permease protein